MTTKLTKCVPVLFVSVCAALCLSGQADADDFRVSNYNKYKDDKVFQVYVHGVGEGLSWANAELKSRGQALLYCPPELLALGANKHADILRREITEHAEEQLKEAPIELMLLRGLRRTFPCKGGKP